MAAPPINPGPNIPPTTDPGLNQPYENRSRNTTHGTNPNQRTTAASVRSGELSETAGELSDRASEPRSNEATSPRLSIPSHLQAQSIDINTETRASVASLRDWVIADVEARQQDYIYVDNQTELENLLSTQVLSSDGQLTLEPGPLATLLSSGGTLIVNEEGFSDKELIELSSIKVKKPFREIKISDSARVISLINRDKQSVGKRAGALISKAHYFTVPNDQLKAVQSLPVAQAQDHPKESVTVFDVERSPDEPLFDASIQWRSGGWVSKKGVLETQLKLGKSVVLRNPPSESFHFQQKFQQWEAKFKAKGLELTLEKGITDAELSSVLEKKTPATEIVAQLSSAKAREQGVSTQMAHQQLAIWTVNQSNVHQFFQQGLYRVAPSQGGSERQAQSAATRQSVIPLQPILHQQAQESESPQPSISPASSAPSAPSTSPTPSPTLLVTEPLTTEQWHALMQADYHFSIAASESVSVPTDYQAQVQTLPLSQDRHLTMSQVATEPVSIVTTADPELTLHKLDGEFSRHSQETAHLYVTPNTDLSHIALKTSFTFDDNKQISGSSELRQLIHDLKSGKRVVIHGLENNPNLQRSLATLINEPNYLYLDGDRFDLGVDGEFGLLGQLLVVTTDATITAQYGSVPTWQDQSTQERTQYHTELKNTLIGAGNSAELVDQLFRTLDKFQAHGLIDDTSSHYNFTRLSSLLKSAAAIDSGGGGRSAQGQGEVSQQARRVLKERLTGDFRSNPLKFTKAKVLFKSEWGKSDRDGVTTLSGRSVDRGRFEAVLKRSDQQLASSLQAAEPTFQSQQVTALWQCLNCFSPDVIEGLLTESPLTNARIADFIQDFKAADQRSETNGEPPLGIQDQPPATEKKASHQIDRLNEKIVTAFDNDRALFLKSAAGLGKTHAIKRIAGAHYQQFIAARPDLAPKLQTSLAASVLQQQRSPISEKPILLDVSQVGHQELHDAIETWALAEGSRLLVMDEANLASSESLAVLKEVFAHNSVTVNGKRLPISDHHKLLFTGNYDFFEGRTVQEVANNSFTTITLKPFSQQYLKETFVEPVLSRANSLHSTVIPRSITQPSLETAIVQLHEAVTKALPEQAFSVRNLEEFVAEFVALRSLDPSGEIGLQLVQSASDTYLQGVSNDVRHAAQLWLERAAGTLLGSQAPETASSNTSNAQVNVHANAQSKAYSLPPNPNPNLIPTQSLSALGERLDRWLSSHFERAQFNPKATAGTTSGARSPKTLGQRGFLIEGPPDRGKASLIQTVLKQKGIPPEKIKTLQADGKHLEPFFEGIKEAARLGQVLVVKNLNTLPSRTLESALNSIMTGDAPNVHPDFCLIATANPPTDTGRESLSPAILNRMVVNRVGEYSKSELQSLAAEFAKQALPAQSPDAMAVRRATPNQIESLASAHYALVQASIQEGVAAPSTRLLFSAVQDLVSNPREVSTVVSESYRYYQEQLQERGVSVEGVGPEEGSEALERSTSEGAGQSDQALLSALSLAFTLDKPEWEPPPTCVVNSTNAFPVEFNPISQQIEVHLSHPRLAGQDKLSYLTKALFATIDNHLQGALPVESALPSGARVNLGHHTVQPLTTFGSSETSAQHRRRNPIAAGVRAIRRRISNAFAFLRNHFRPNHRYMESSTPATSAEGTSGRSKLRTNKHSDARTDPRSFGRSGVGGDDPSKMKIIGQIDSGHELIRNTVWTLDETLVDNRSMSPRLNHRGEPQRVTTVTMNNEPRFMATTKQPSSTLYLKMLPYTMPVNVQLSGDTLAASPRSGGVDLNPIYQNGVWCIKCPPGQAVTYDLIEANMMEPASPSISLKRGELSFDQNPGLKQCIEGLKEELHSDRRTLESVVQELDRYFKDADHFTYDIKSGDHYVDCKNNTDRYNVFIAKKHGVCFEYSGAFASILEQEFNIPARRVSGSRVINQQFKNGGHAWLEYWNSDQQKWIEVDPTGGGAGAALDNAASNQAAVRAGPGSNDARFDSGTSEQNSGPQAQAQIQSQTEPRLQAQSSVQTPSQQVQTSESGSPQRQVTRKPIIHTNSTQPSARANPLDHANTRSSAGQDAPLFDDSNKDLTPPYSDDAQFTRRFTQRLEALGLFHQESQAVTRYTADSQAGVLDIGQVLRGSPNCFRTVGLSESSEPKALYFQYTPDVAQWQSENGQNDFPIALSAVVNQMLKLDVPIYITHEDQAYPIESARDLFHWMKGRLPKNRGEPISEKSLKQDIHLTTPKATDQLLNQVGKVYYQTMIDHVGERRGAVAGVLMQTTDQLSRFLPLSIPTESGEYLYTEEEHELASQSLPDSVANKAYTLDEFVGFYRNFDSPVTQKRMAQFIVNRPLDNTVETTVGHIFALSALIDHPSTQVAEFVAYRGNIAQSIQEMSAHLKNGENFDLSQLNEIYKQASRIKPDPTHNTGTMSGLPVGLTVARGAIRQAFERVASSPATAAAAAKEFLFNEDGIASDLVDVLIRHTQSAGRGRADSDIDDPQPPLMRRGRGPDLDDP